MNAMAALTERRRELAMRSVAAVLGVGGFLVALAVWFSATAEHFFSTSNLVIILSSVAVIGVVAIGQTFAIVAGGFDLSVAGSLPLGAVVFAKSLNAGHPIVLASVLAMLAGAGVGVVNGILVTLARIDPLIATLGTVSITVGFTRTIADGVNVPFGDLDDGFLAASSIGDIPNSVWIFGTIAVLATFVLRATVYGRQVYALGGNAEATWLAGVRVRAVTASVYVLTGALSAFAGVIVASQLLSGSPNAGGDAALTSIAAVILGGGLLGGGVGSVPGTVIGVLVLGTLRNGLALSQVPAFYQDIATGAVLLAAVGFSRLRRFIVQRPVTARVSLASNEPHDEQGGTG